MILDVSFIRHEARNFLFNWCPMVSLSWASVFIVCAMLEDVQEWASDSYSKSVGLVYVGPPDWFEELIQPDSRSRHVLATKLIATPQGPDGRGKLWAQSARGRQGEKHAGVVLKKRLNPS